MKFLVINGPNLNMLGIREPHIYGSLTYKELCTYIENLAIEYHIQIDIVQSNHEGDIVDTIQNAYQKYDGIVINAGAYTHTSIAILDALKAVDISAVEVHLSNIYQREDFRRISYVGMACFASFMGEGILGYQKAIQALIRKKEGSL